MKDIHVLYEDGSILVLDKPAGLVVNKADTTKGEPTVQEWVEEKVKNREKAKVETDSEFYKRGGIVHRLDKETSGVLIVAKNERSFYELQKQFKERSVKKSYEALVHGEVHPQEGEIRLPLGRLPWNRKRFGVVAGGREAITRYKVLSTWYLVFDKTKEPLTLLQLYPQTGRTHQIRVHLKHIGHPIVSDFLYAGRKTARNDRKYLPRVFLHASTISFLHPTTQEKIEFTSKLPDELDNLLNHLKH